MAHQLNFTSLDKPSPSHMDQHGVAELMVTTKILRWLSAGVGTFSTRLRIQTVQSLDSQRGQVSRENKQRMICLCILLERITSRGYIFVFSKHRGARITVHL